MSINKYIDHTLLKPDATTEAFEKLCQEAREYDFKSVCVNPSRVPLVKKLLAGSDVLACTVIGFPLGATSAQAKAEETKIAFKDGADEFDMVINIGALKSGDFDTVLNDIKAVRDASSGKTLKVILETCLLTEQEIKKACELCLEAKADFVKTSTGFSTGGATIEAVTAMLDVVKGKAEVKASGGVRSLEDAQKYIEMGVTRLGTSSGVAIMQGQVSQSSY
jgi:deoxyribose-phosphate aldolase